MTFEFAIFVKWSCAGKGQKYAFIFMGNRRRVWDNKNAHVCPETAHSAIMRIDQHRPVGGLGLFAATEPSLGVIKGVV